MFMLIVNVNGCFIENIIIQDNKLLFSELDPETNEAVYTARPVNEYGRTSDKFFTAEAVLNEEDYLGFENPENIELFKELVLQEHEKGNNSFNYHGLAISFEEIPDIEDIAII